MRRGRRAKYTKHPLFKLRGALGETETITQPELGEIIDVSISSLQSIETSRRGKGILPEAILNKIQRATGAVWNSKEWVFPCWSGELGSLRFIPFTFELYRQYRSICASVEWEGYIDRDAIKLRIDALFFSTPPDRKMLLFYRIQDFLDECRKDFAVEKFPSDLRELFGGENALVPFRSTKDVLSFKTDPETGAMELFRSYPFSLVQGGDAIRRYRKEMSEYYAVACKWKSNEEATKVSSIRPRRKKH
jgi:hypothetical protein